MIARTPDTTLAPLVPTPIPGVRVAPENASRIFEPLFTTKARGLGLGLALSKTLAQANGGDLTLVSGAGESARFTFTVPVSGAGA